MTPDPVVPILVHFPCELPVLSRDHFLVLLYTHPNATMVRILCLHGTGSSAQIFETQTGSDHSELHLICYVTDFIFAAAIRACLPGHWEFCFYDADIECGPLPQLEGLYPGPFFTNFAIPTVAVMRDIHQWLLDIVEEDGPFDGFMGFSAVRSEFCYREDLSLTERL